MALLEFDRVSMRYGPGRSSRIGQREQIVLRDISLQLYAGEMMAIWGLRGSGRSTLIHLAAGLLRPSAGVVRFAEHDLATRRGLDLGGGIGFCQRTFRTTGDLRVKDQLIYNQRARGISTKDAEARTWRALERAGADRFASLTPVDLDGAQAAQVMIARALILDPMLLLIDEPTMGVDLIERNQILDLLRSLADEGMAVLTCNSETAAFRGCDRALSLREGELVGQVRPELAAVTDIATQRRASG
jgi:putative ABC transport system ATP-binding protein